MLFRSIILKKYSAISEYEDECKMLTRLLEKLIEGNILITDNSTICICGKKENEKYVGLNLSGKYINILEDRKVFNERIMPTFNIVEREEKLLAKAIVPIIVDSSVTGSIAIFSTDENVAVREKDIELLKFASSILSNKIKS